MDAIKETDCEKICSSQNSRTTFFKEMSFKVIQAFVIELVEKLCFFSIFIAEYASFWKGVEEYAHFKSKFQVQYYASRWKICGFDTEVEVDIKQV